MPIRICRRIRKNIVEDGLITDSSSFLVNTMVGRIDFGHTLRILEIGSGRGAFTRAITDRMSKESELDVCEIKSEYNPWIERILEANPSKRVTLHNRCATEMLTRPESYDIIVSSLPLRNLERKNGSNEFLYRVIEALRYGLKTGGCYLQYQYFRSNKNDIETIFGKRMDRVDFVPLNILPAFVYSMTKASA